MDGPNAPNPTNPAAQDQFVDAVQGQGPAVQGLTAQAPGPANNNAPVGPNAPIQPPHNQPQHSQSPLVW